MGGSAPLPMVTRWRRRRRIGRWALRLWFVFAALVTGVYLASLVFDLQTFWVTSPVAPNASGDPSRWEAHARLSGGCFTIVSMNPYRPGQAMDSFDVPNQASVSKALAWSRPPAGGGYPRQLWPSAFINGWPAYWRVPLWPGAVFVGVVSLLIGRHYLRKPKAWQCKGDSCRYDLRGQKVRAGEPLVCPECGRMNQCPVCGHPTGGALGAAACGECGWRVSGG